MNKHYLGPTSHKPRKDKRKRHRPKVLRKRPDMPFMFGQERTAKGPEYCETEQKWIVHILYETEQKGWYESGQAAFSNLTDAIRFKRIQNRDWDKMPVYKPLPGNPRGPRKKRA